LGRLGTAAQNYMLALLATSAAVPTTAPKVQLTEFFMST